MLPATGRQYRGCIIPQVVTHRLVLLKMGKITAWNMLCWLELLISHYLYLVSCLYYLYQWCTLKQISDNEIYLLIKYIKSVLWKVAKRLSYIQDARSLKVNVRNVLAKYGRFLLKTPCIVPNENIRNGEYIRIWRYTIVAYCSIPAFERPSENTLWQ